MRGPLLVALLLTLPGIAGCLQARPGETDGASVTAGTSFPPEAAFVEGETWSSTLLPGPYGHLEVEDVMMPSFDGVKIHMGIFRPDVPEGTKVPVIVDAGPYYLDGDEAATSDQTHRLGGFLIENFVPHGYAVAQVSIRGTGLSTGCVDYMGEKEQRDLDAVVTFLGEQEWSNGNVGMIGRSYDGSTPWEAATFGNPALKTIVPISGIDDLQMLHYRNGTAEVRSLSLGSLYYTFGATNGGLGGPEDDPTLAQRMACAEGPQHTPMGAYGAATGGGHVVPGPGDSYWTTREFSGRVLANYKGSIFYVHGLQDWNVRPAQGADIYNAFEGPKKALLGQWAHNYPDRPEEHDHLRWDWAEMLLRWFDQELKGVKTDTGPALQIEDSRGDWRAEPQNEWPPQDATWTNLFPSAGGALVAAESSGDAVVFSPAPLADAGQDAPTAPRILAFESAPFENMTRISGQPRLHVSVESNTPGGNVWAELWEIPETGERLQIGRAQMDLRYAAGGKTATVYTPGTVVQAKMEFYPLDARLLPGSKLLLLLTGESTSNLANPLSAQLTFHFGDDLTSLQLPFVDRPVEPSRWDVTDAKVKGESA